MVLKAVLTVFTCLLMRLLDLEYRGNNVMWLICCLCKNLAKSSDKKGHPLSANAHLGSQYCEMRSCYFCVRDWNVLDEALYRNRYLLKVSQMANILSFSG